MIDERQMTQPFLLCATATSYLATGLTTAWPLEPEWAEFKEQARKALDKLFALWRVERERVELYGDEAGLEEKFIQPVFEILGWHLKYQTSLKNRRPDYALFLTDGDLTAAIGAGRTSPISGNTLRLWLTPRHGTSTWISQCGLVRLASTRRNRLSGTLIIAFAISVH